MKRRNNYNRGRGGYYRGGNRGGGYYGGGYRRGGNNGYRGGYNNQYDYYDDGYNYNNDKMVEVEVSSSSKPFLQIRIIIIMKKYLIQEKK